MNYEKKETEKIFYIKQEHAKMKHSEQNVLLNKNIAIVSTCLDDWGGSEDVWSMCIPYLQKEEFSISVLKERVNFKHKRIAQLKN